MTKEEKELLLTDLCARLPFPYIKNYKLVKCFIYTIRADGKKESWAQRYVDIDLIKLFVANDNYGIVPYLRPMSNMTEEERTEFYKVGGLMSHKVETNTYVLTAFSPDAYDWLNKHYFDYRGLIKKGLALKAPEGMYKID